MQTFAVSILSYNHPEITAKCLRSVLALHPPENIFLTHNGSLAAHQEQLINEFPQINHHLVKNNNGYSAGANETLKNVFEKFENVLFLTNDTELINLPTQPPHGFCSVQLLKRNTAEIDSIMGALNPKNGSLKHLKNLNDIKQNEISYIPGTAFWLDKKTYSILGSFDERFHTYWEDVDLSLRAHKLGIKLQYSSETVCRHKIGKTCHKHRFYTYELFQRNRGRCLSKNNLISFGFYFSYIPDILKYSRSDYKKAFSIFKEHRMKA